MKIKGTFLSYISEEKRLRKEQNRLLKASSRSKKAALEEPVSSQAKTSSVAELQLN